MKNLKRILSIVLILVLALSFAGCHKKGEIAVEVGEWKFTSAYYMCAFIQAEREAQAMVYESLSDKEKQDADLDYTKKKVEGKKYDEWVKDTAIDYIKGIAFLKTLCKENKLDVDNKELRDTYNQMIPSIWEDTSYGYYYAEMYFGDTIPQGTSLQMNYEPNGVSQATYIDYAVDKSLSETYFNHLYSEGGEKEISKEDIEKEFYGNYELANVLDVTIENATDKDKLAELKAKVEKYKADIESGKMTFAEVKADYEKPATEDKKEESDEHNHEEEDKNTEEENKTEEAAKPKDENAQVIASEDENYKTIKAMKVGEVKIVETETALTLIVKQDLKADEYYIKQYDSTVRHTLKDEEFSKFIEDSLKKEKADVNNYAVKQFKVKKIEIPEAVSTY